MITTVLDKRRKYSLNEKAFDTLTEESAYWLGFLAADGSVRDNTVGLDLATKDENHLVKFLRFLEADYLITAREKVNSRRVTISSPTLIQSLQKYGLSERKAHRFIAVPELLENRHFWRGYVDGDGSFGIYKRQRRASFQLGFHLVSCSKRLLEQFCQFVNNHESKLNLKVYTRSNPTAFIISTAARKARSILDLLYLDSTIALSRKQKRYIEISRRI